AGRIPRHHLSDADRVDRADRADPGTRRRLRPASMSLSEVYRYPEYYALGYRWNTETECDFIEAALRVYGPAKPKRLLDIGCGAGRHMRRLATRGYEMTGIDPSPEMVAYVQGEAKVSGLK